ncbi:hypothetical protein SBRCBS47491_009585 [Sporothrix bragantina]|uniref:N-acetyltransferase domain-containing protein n=1 Tax=Sporothrix bragantina TaxID=671064 RepID=A0ABP0CWW3_9PEZI
MDPPDMQDSSRRRGAVVAQDLQECLPLTSTLDEGDLLYLLTPVVVPVELPTPGSPAKDPFEPLGRALAKYHPWVRHIPYVVRDGITQYHANHLSLAKAVVFVITGPPYGGQISQVTLSQSLGSALPRLLLGPLVGSDSEEWFRRRGWRIDASGLPGTGQIASDWVLDLSDWRASGLSDNGLTFLRYPEKDDPENRELLEFVMRESARHDNVGWYDQYLRLAHKPDAYDILVVLEGNQIVASAISYVCGKDSKMAEDMPWPNTISSLAGGVSCICITEDRLSPNNTRDMVILRLINYSVHVLGSQGVRKMFLDGVRGGEEGFQSVATHL